MLTTRDDPVGHARGLILVLAAVFTLSACSNAPPSPTPPTETGVTPVASATISPSAPKLLDTIVATEHACAYAGPQSVAPGRVSIEVSNQTAVLVNLELISIGNGHTYQELASHIEAEQDRIEAGGQPSGPPGWATVLVQAPIGSGEEGALVVNIETGSYALVCAQIDPKAQRVAAITASGSFEVA